MPRVASNTTNCRQILTRFNSSLNKEIWANIGTFLARKGRMETSGHTLETQKPQLRSYHENSVVDGPCNSCWVPKQSRNSSFLGYFWRFWANFGYFCGRGETLWPEDIILCSEILNTCYLKKIKVFITCKQPLEASHRENSKVFGQFVTFFGSCWPFFAREVNWWLADTIQSHRIIIQDYLMIKESLTTNETHVDASQRANSSVLWLFLEI